MRDRALLHKSKLQDFTQWLEDKNYERLRSPAAAAYEVLRWRGRAGRAMPIIFDRDDATEHYTCNGEAAWFVRQWLRELEAAKRREGV